MLLCSNLIIVMKNLSTRASVIARLIITSFYSFQHALSVQNASGKRC